ncbi:MAG: hypothetical protein HGB12_05715 [Bacteroidetes bacterium]|nr:hypothetical protein [Bacteroidota bacterium]
METKKTFQIARSIVYTLLAFLFSLFTFHSFSQGVAINTTGNEANTSALLDVNSTVSPYQGMLMPRLTTTNRDLINSPATGLMIFNTDCKEMQFYDGTAWISVSTLALPFVTEGSGATETQITANWNASSGAIGYYLDVATDNAFTGILSNYDNLNVSNVTTYNVTGLTCGTSYYYRVKAYNTCGTSSNSSTITYPTNPFICGSSTVNDIDGNTYNTVLLGTQCWLKENMRTTKYPDNTAIAKGDAAAGDTDWGIDHAWYSCPPNTGNTAEDCAAAASLGLLYQWSAVMHSSTTDGAQGICPSGWHVPTDAEWCTMENTVEAGTDASCSTTGWRGINTGSKMAADVAAQSWTSGNLRSGTGFNNTSGLKLGPSGMRHTNGNYYSRSDGAEMWTSTVNVANPWMREVNNTITQVNRSTIIKAMGFSVRCLKDN